MSLVKISSNQLDTLHVSLSFSDAGYMAMLIFGLNQGQTYYESTKQISNVALPTATNALIFFECSVPQSKKYNVYFYLGALPT